MGSGDRGCVTDGPAGGFCRSAQLTCQFRQGHCTAPNRRKVSLNLPAPVRLDAPTNEHKIALDDWPRSVRELAPAGVATAHESGDLIASMFLRDVADPFVPAPISAAKHGT